MSRFLIILPIFFPILSVLVSLPAGKVLAGERGRQNAWAAFSLGLEALLVLFASLAGVGILHVHQPDILVYGIGPEITDRISLLLKLDGISVAFSGTAAFMWLITGIFSFGHFEHEKNTLNFFRFYLLTEGAVMALAYAGNYATLFGCLIAISLLSFPMILHAGSASSVFAAKKYLFYTIFGACLSLAGLFYMSEIFPDTSFIAGGYAKLVMPDAGQLRILLVVVLLALIGFGAMAGMFPLHAWESSALAASPAPAGAIVSGLITKCGAIAVIRIVFYLAGADVIRGTYVQTVWMILSLVTMFMGAMLAWMERDLLKRLAYASVSAVSGILFGLSTLTDFGMMGGLLQLVFLSLVPDLLFLCAGAVIHRTGVREVNGLKGMGKRMPVTMWCFTIAALGLAGIPPACGFYGLWHLGLGSLGCGMGVLSVVGAVVLILSALLSVGFLLSISMSAFLPGHDFDYKRFGKCDPGRCMRVPMIVLAVLVIAGGIFSAMLAGVFSDIIAACGL